MNQKREFSKKLPFVSAIQLAQDKMNANNRRNAKVFYEFIAVKKVVSSNVEYEYDYRDSVLSWNDRVKDGESCAGNDFVVSWIKYYEP